MNETINPKIDVMMNEDNWNGWIKEGEKVKLDIDRITSRNWDGLTPKYKTFVTDNEDIQFTVKYVEIYGKHPHIVTFQEDDTWRFWIGYLIKVDDE